MIRTLKLLAIFVSVAALAACSTWTKEQKAWSDLLRNSDIRMVTGDRVIIDAWGPARTSLETVELRLLARAGAEVNKLGYTHFVILHVRDRNLPIAGSFSGASIFGSDEKRIGTYEALVRDRYERDYGAAPRAWWNPGLTAVIQPLNAAEDEIAFNAGELYETINRSEMPR